MPRASYGDRNTVTAIQGDNHQTFNLTSRVLDFLIIEDKENGEKYNILKLMIFTLGKLNNN